jgi:hypothetical protein
MAGFSGYTVGHVNNKVAYIPIEELLSGIIIKNKNNLKENMQIEFNLKVELGKDF